MASVGSNSAICRISSRFFSPPEKPTLSARFSISSETFSAAAFSRTSLQHAHRIDFLLAARAALRVQRGLEEIERGDAGNFHRILHGEEHALRRALFRRQRGQVFAVVA